MSLHIDQSVRILHLFTIELLVIEKWIKVSSYRSETALQTILIPDPEDQKIKPGVEDDDQSKKTKAAMAEASTIGWGRRWKTHIGQKTGFVEQTKLEPRFEVRSDEL